MGHRILYIPKADVIIPTSYYYGTGGIATGSGTSISVPYPPGIESGDMLLLHVLAKSDMMGINQPTGWGVTWSGYIAGVVTYVNYKKAASGSESGNLNITFTTSERRGVIMYVYKHANTYLNHGNTIINNSIAGTSTGFAGEAGQLQASSLYINRQTNVTVSGTGWVENSNLSTVDNGGFTFVNATYAFSMSETAPTASFTLDDASYGDIHRSLMKHTP